MDEFLKVALFFVGWALFWWLVYLWARSVSDPSKWRCN